VTCLDASASGAGREMAGSGDAVKGVKIGRGSDRRKRWRTAGFYSNENVRTLQERGIEAYLPDPNLGRELNTGKQSAHDWTEPGTQSGTEGDAEEVAQRGRTTGVRTTQGAGRTGVWRVEATAWDAAISHAKTSQSGGRVHAGGGRLQPDAPVRSKPKRVTRRLRSKGNGSLTIGESLGDENQVLTHRLQRCD